MAVSSSSKQIWKKLPEKGGRPGRRWCSAWSSRNVKFWHCNTFGSFKHFLSSCRWRNLKRHLGLKLPRQVQCLNKVFPSSQKLCCEVEGFNMVQHGSTTFYSLIIARVFVTECHWSTMHWRCWCGKWSEWSNETFRCHNLAHRILLSACAHCRALLSQSRQRQWVWTMSCHKS